MSDEVSVPSDRPLASKMVVICVRGDADTMEEVSVKSFNEPTHDKRQTNERSRRPTDRPTYLP